MTLSDVKQVPYVGFLLWQNDIHIGFMTEAEKRVKAFFDNGTPIPSS